jgi:hypothetical protein
MKAPQLTLFVGILTLAGCASTDVAQKDTLNERSDRMAHLEDRLPPNPNRPTDTRDLKAPPVVVQHDPALDKPTATAPENKALEVTAGADQFVRPQDPTVSAAAPKDVGTPATAQTANISKADNELATRVKDAIAKVQNPAANNTDPAKQSPETNGEAKAVQNLEVTAKNGQVNISGSVATETERTAIEQAATHVPGVTSLSNYLTVTKTDKP